MYLWQKVMIEAREMSEHGQAKYAAIHGSCNPANAPLAEFLWKLKVRTWGEMK
jgi:hypothetical protein